MPTRPIGFVLAILLGLANSAPAQPVPFKTPSEAKAWLSNAGIAPVPASSGWT